MSPKINSLKTNAFFKVSVIVFIGLLLLIPKSMIQSLIHEREATRQNAIEEVGFKWGGEQTIIGPFLTIPYITYIKEVDQNKKSEKLIKVIKHIYILPDKLAINGEINPEKRYRGIYEIVVYNSKLNLQGSFDKLNLKELGIPLNNILFNRATLSLGISDLRGIENQVKLKWNDSIFSFNPGTVTHEVISSGINTQIPLKKNDSTFYKFSIDLDLKGSQRLFFVPVGKMTDIHLHSNWNNPSFNGAFLPDKREVSNNGFKAHWNILHLNRNFPQQWTNSTYRLENWAFGVNLLLPVDHYQKSLRAIKYAILFIALTFMVFFFVEVTRKVFIHPIQYILVGIALIIFYSLLLAISEHTNFNFAFAISAIATLLLITFYVKAILKSNQLAILIGGILAILYVFIFTIIQLQDYALLIGSIGLFIILALVMYYSRKIDWYNLYGEND